MALATCAVCKGELVGSEVGFGTCGHCGGRSALTEFGTSMVPGEMPGRRFEGIAHETLVPEISVRAEAEGVRGSAVEVPARIDARTRRLLWVLAVVLILGQLAWLNPLP